MKSASVTIQTKATAEYFPVVLFIKLYKGVLALKSVELNESYWATYFPVQLFILLYKLVPTFSHKNDH